MTIVRPAIVFGPNVDNYIVRAFENNPFVPLLDGVDQEFQFVHEDDVVSALIALLDGKHAGAFNLAGDGTAHLGRAAELLGKKTRNDLAEEHEAPQRAMWGCTSPDGGAAGEPRLRPLPMGGLDREAQVDRGLAAPVRHPRDLQDHDAREGPDPEAPTVVQPPTTPVA